jgi:hypothetical protein
MENKSNGGPDIYVEIPSPTADDIRAERRQFKVAATRGKARMVVAFRLYEPELPGKPRRYRDIKGMHISVRCSSAEAVAAVRRKVEEALREIDGARLEVAP